jgi:hypothetical protein
LISRDIEAKAEASLPEVKQPQKQEIKVTDKRIFTPEGDIREEFREQIHPVDAPVGSAPAAEAAATPAPEAHNAARAVTDAPSERRHETPARRPPGEERRRTVAEKATNPGTPFSNFIESLIMQAYMLLGMLRDPRQPAMPADAPASRQMIDILILLQDKTAGNLTPDEEDFLETHLADLKLAYVQRTKNI